MPILWVSDPTATRAFYERLGFAVNGVWGDPPMTTIMQRGTVTVMFNRSDTPVAGGGRWAVYIYVDDVDALHREWTARGVTAPDPEDRYYGCRDFTLLDPDGYGIVFGTDLTPTHGPGLAAPQEAL